MDGGGGMSDSKEPTPPEDSVSLADVLKTMKVSDMIDESEARLALVTVDHDANTIDFVGAWYTKEDPYWIPFRELGSVCAFLEWVRHVGEKDWVTKDHLYMFAQRYMVLVRNGILPSDFYSKGAK
jgi:hypothetical protein